MRLKSARPWKKWLGVFDVNYSFTELSDSNSQSEAKNAPKAYVESTTEWIAYENQLESETLVHIMALENFNFRHFAQHWRPASQALQTTYLGDHIWKLEAPLENAEQWTELISQVDGSPRYSGSGNWATDPLHQWHNLSPSLSPVPRRDGGEDGPYTKIGRQNFYYISDDRWEHKQINIKYFKGSDQKIIGEEGTITYIRAADNSKSAEKCQAAEAWWQKPQEYLASNRPSLGRRTKTFYSNKSYSCFTG